MMIPSLMPFSYHPRAGVWHFTGLQATAEAGRAVDLGCGFSVNAEMLVNDKRTAVTRTLPLGRLLTETDGPFTRTGDHPSMPNDVRVAVEGLACMHGMEAIDCGNHHTTPQGNPHGA